MLSLYGTQAPSGVDGEYVARNGARLATQQEQRGPRYILGFSCGCVASSLYGWLSGAWPFGVVELIWATIALRRYRDER